MSNLPQVANANCRVIRFLPGDRVVVRVNERLTRERRRKLQKTIEKWAGDAVEILIVELPVFDIQVIHGEQ